MCGTLYSITRLMNGWTMKDIYQCLTNLRDSKIIPVIEGV